MNKLTCLCFFCGNASKKFVCKIDALCFDVTLPPGIQSTLKFYATLKCTRNAIMLRTKTVLTPKLLAFLFFSLLNFLICSTLIRFALENIQLILNLSFIKNNNNVHLKLFFFKFLKHEIVRIVFAQRTTKSM